MKRQLPDLRNSAPGLAPHRLAKADATAKPLGYRFVNDANDPTVTELWLYDEISPFGIMAQDVIDELMNVTTPNLRVRINSPGGSVFEGIAIANALASFPAVVTGVVDALCASIATVIAMACESITMSPGSQMMIHSASGVCIGNSAEMTQMASMLDFQTSNIADLYSARAGGTSADWLAVMKAETWYTADEAVTAGLADATGIVKQSGNSVVPAGSSWDDLWDLSIYKFAGRAKAPAPMAPEQILALVDLVQPQLDYVENKCGCGPKGFRVVDRDGQHTTECPALGAFQPRDYNGLPDPVGVQWEVVSNGNACDICEDVIDASPYDEDDLPDVPVHPNCDCDLQVAYGVNNTASSPQPAAEVEFDTELFRSTIREVFA